MDGHINHKNATITCKGINFSLLNGFQRDQKGRFTNLGIEKEILTSPLQRTMIIANTRRLIARFFKNTP